MGVALAFRLLCTNSLNEFSAATESDYISKDGSFIAKSSTRSNFSINRPSNLVKMTVRWSTQKSNVRLMALLLTFSYYRSSLWSLTATDESTDWAKTVKMVSL